MICAQHLPRGTAKSILRFFYKDDVPLMAPFDAVCVIDWEPKTRSFWCHGLKGRLNRKLLLDLLEFAEAHQIETIKAVRAGGHAIPGGVVQPNGDLHVSVSAMRSRYPCDSGFAAL